MAIFFDVTRTWLSWHGPPDGVARTVFGLCDAGAPLGIMPIVHHPLRAAWYRVPRFTASSRVVAEELPLANVVCGRADRLPGLRTAARAWTWWKRLRDLEILGEPVDLGAGDAVHLLEPVWPSIPGHAAAVARLKQRHPGCEVVALVHDLSPLEMPEYASRRERRGCLDWSAFLGGHADRIVVGSRAVADSVRRHVPGRPVAEIRLASSIDSCQTTAPLAVEDMVRMLEGGGWCAAAAADPIVRRREWLLTVGRLEPRKNHALLLDVLEPLWAAGRLDLPLVIVGLPSTAAGTLRRRVRGSPVLSRHVALLGAVPDEVLWQLYRGARLSVAPSLYDGFSRPVAESLQFGTPCLASRAGGISEVAGERVDSFDPRSAAHLEKLVVRFLEEPGYESRLRSLAGGFIAHTWADTVADMTGRSARAPALPRRPPIDVVYTWCDDSDPLFRDRLACWRKDSRDEAAAGDARFRTHDELRYSLRSLEAHAPWVRRVHLVTNGQVPSWLDRRHPDMHLVSHADIFEDVADLPCFNSLAIETNLHRIPNLAESFLYLNDDFLIGNHLSPAAFFCSAGRPVFFVESYPLPGPRSPWFARAEEDLMKRCHRYNHRLLREKLRSRLDARDPPHVPQLYDRRVLASLERTWLREMRATRSCRFRTPRNVKLAVLYPFFAAESPLVDPPAALRTLVNGSAEYIFRTVQDRDLAAVDGWLAEIEAVRPTFFCVNDAVDGPEGAVALRGRYRAMLERYFPTPSRFERET